MEVANNVCRSGCIVQGTFSHSSSEEVVDLYNRVAIIIDA